MRLILQEALVACFVLTIPVTTAHGIHNRAMAIECNHPDDAYQGPNYEYPCDEDVESGYNTKSPTTAPTDFPSVAPSGFPSSSPSDSPSGFPSSSPSDSPSGFPSSSPSDSPSGSPSSPPSDSPSGFPSSSPSNSPSGSPSMLPSDTPSPTTPSDLMPSNSPSLSGSPTSSQSPSSSPSLSRSPSSSSAPTLTAQPTSLSEQCVSSFGVFGDISWTSTVVDFGYELETSVAGDDIEELVLPDLEVAMVDSVLSGIFPDGCDQPGTRKLQLQRRLRVEGISGNPEDRVLDDISCQTQLDSENTCVVVSGQMTLYVNGDLNAEAALLQNILNKNMEDGTYVNGQIARVSYVQLDPSPDGQQNDVSQVRDGGGTGDGLTVGMGLGVAAACAAVAFIAGVVFSRRRKKSQNDENTTLSPNVNSYSNFGETDP